MAEKFGAVAANGVCGVLLSGVTFCMLHAVEDTSTGEPTELIGFVAEESGDTSDEADVDDSTGELRDCCWVMLFVILLAAIEASSVMFTYVGCAIGADVDADDVVGLEEDCACSLDKTGPT